VIQHIVLMKVKPGTTDEEIEAAFEAGGDLPDEIPGPPEAHLRA
jgi:Stress responsive A/B Barrel Domain